MIDDCFLFCVGVGNLVIYVYWFLMMIFWILGVNFLYIVLNFKVIEVVNIFILYKVMLYCCLDFVFIDVLGFWMGLLFVMLLCYYVRFYIGMLGFYLDKLNI